jgi:hypothetical protein
MRNALGLVHVDESFPEPLHLPTVLNSVWDDFNRNFKRLEVNRQRAIWDGICKLFMDKYDGGPEQLESWVTLRELDEITDMMETLTPRGAVRVLQSMDLLEGI